jgi:hypothetical protein
MELLIKTLIAIGARYGDRIREERWNIARVLEPRFEQDSRVPLLIAALDLDVTGRLKSGAPWSALAELLTKEKLFSDEAAAWAVAAWATAIGTADASHVPTLAPASQQSLAELASASLPGLVGLSQSRSGVAA